MLTRRGEGPGVDSVEREMQAPARREARMRRDWRLEIGRESDEAMGAVARLATVPSECGLRPPKDVPRDHY